MTKDNQHGKSATRDSVREVFPLTDGEFRDLAMFHAGIVEAAEALQEQDSDLPGMELAIATLELLAVKKEGSMLRRLYRLAAVAGVDIATVQEVNADISDGEFVLVAEREAPAE